MSDPDVPKSERSNDVDDVVGNANAGLDAAEAARADVPGTADAPAAADGSRADAPADPDLAAFEAAERDHPGTFQPPAAPAPPLFSEQTSEPAAVATTDNRADNRDDMTATRSYRDERPAAEPAYAWSSSDDDDTRVLSSEPQSAAASPLVPQPIFVQAPEAPRDRGNRGTAAAIGLLATLVFAVLYLATTIGLGALAGDVTASNIGTSALAPLTTWGFWTPVVVFFLGFWLLGAIINRGRWGRWVVFGIIVGVIAYGGHILGQVFEARFWTLSPSAGLELVGEQLLAPLAIAAFVFARELTIWFGAWVARSGARKTELNAEAQREYERTLEAGPTLAR